MSGLRPSHNRFPVSKYVSWKPSFERVSQLGGRSTAPPFNHVGGNVLLISHPPKIAKHFNSSPRKIWGVFDFLTNDFVQKLICHPHVETRWFTEGYLPKHPKSQATWSLGENWAKHQGERVHTNQAVRSKGVEEHLRPVMDHHVIRGGQHATFKKAFEPTALQKVSVKPLSI